MKNNRKIIMFSFQILSIRISVLSLVMFALFSCRTASDHPIKIEGKAQGTYYAITYYDDKGRVFNAELDSLFKSFDRSASVYLKESVISRFNKNDSTVVADSVFEVVFRKAMEVSRETNGAFDITVMPLVNAWGWGFTERSKVDSSMVDSLLPLVGYNKIDLVEGRLIKDNEAIMIDYNAIAQGFTCDVIGKYFESKGIDSYLIDVGGEVLAKGKKPDGSSWNVAIEKPANDLSSERAIQTVIQLNNKALATSGNYRKFFLENGQKYSHTIDPKTGYPVQHSVLSVSVLANDCMTADAYATAFMVMGLEKARDFLASHSELEAYIIYDDKGELRNWSSRGFPIGNQ